MEENQSDKSEKTSRREIIKKAGKVAVFVIPTIATFNITDVQARVSGKPPKPPEW